jgi:hypothetical protein
MEPPTPEQIRELFAVDALFARRERLLRGIAFDDTRSWVDPNGYRLSHRIWLSRQQVREAIDRTLRTAIATGEDALVTARTLEQYLRPHLAVQRTPGRGGAGSYSARRLARTEISRAHGQATLWAAQRSPFVRGVRWSVSARHPRPDECDRNATADNGLGPGVYPPDAVPRYPAHPQCLCVLSMVTVEDDRAIVRELRQLYRLDDLVE